MKQNQKIAIVVTILLAFFIPTVLAAQPEEPKLPELLQNIEDYLEDSLTPSIEDMDHDLSTHDTDMKTELRNHNTYIETKINEHEEHIITALRNHNSYIEGKLAEHASEINEKIDVITDYVDETESKIDTLSSQSHRMYTDLINRIEALDTRVEELTAENQGGFESLDGQLTQIQTVLSGHNDDLSQHNQDMIENLDLVKDYIDEVEDNQAYLTTSIDDIRGVLDTLLSEVDQDEEILAEIRLWQNEYNNYRFTEHQSLADMINDNGNSIDDLQDSVDATSAELQSIEQSINDLESQNNLIFEHEAFSFSADTELGLGERHRTTYDSVRHVSLSVVVSMEAGDDLRVYASIGGQDPQALEYWFYTDFGFNYIEFDTDEWYLYVGSNDHDPELDAYVTVTSFGTQ